MKIKHNIAEEAKKIEGLVGEVQDVLVGTTTQALNEIGVESAKNFLNGPRPKRLGTVSGRLIRAIMGGYSFSGGIKTTGNVAVSNADSIREVKRVGGTIYGTIGIKTFEPFDYPRMWEETGHKAIVPKSAAALVFKTSTGWVRTQKVKAQKARPFLRPAGAEYKSSGRLDKLFDDALGKAGKSIT